MIFDWLVLVLDSAAKSANIESLFMRSVVDSFKFFPVPGLYGLRGRLRRTPS
jgi:hypothetical protein